MKKGIFLFLLSVSYFSFAEDKGYVHHPAPVKPFYISETLYETLKVKTPPVPSRDSQQQKDDEKELRKLQGSRTRQDCERAEREVKVNLQSLFGKPEGSLDEPIVKSLDPFFEKIKNDADFFVQKLKKETTRPRPFTYMKDLRPCVPKEVTNAYPSGHSVIARMKSKSIAEILLKFKSLRSFHSASDAHNIFEIGLIDGKPKVSHMSTVRIKHETFV